MSAQDQDPDVVLIISCSQHSLQMCSCKLVPPCLEVLFRAWVSPLAQKAHQMIVLPVTSVRQELIRDMPTKGLNSWGVKWVNDPVAGKSFKGHI